MKFYKELSKVYDIVFPKSEKTLKFLCEDLKSNSKILDLACGTGTYASALAQRGHRVDGVDLDEEMINIAKGKGGLYANFAVGDMTRLKEEFKGERYDLIYCIGNSIVHLKNEEKIEQLIKDVYEVLNDEGSFIVQIVNYDRIIKYDFKSLPTIDKPQEGVKFIRNYNLEGDDKIEFQTELIINKNNKEERFENSVDLIPLQKKKLQSMFEDAGFSHIKVYGSFLEEEFNDDSFSLVIKGIKIHSK